METKRKSTISQKEAAELLQVHYNTVANWMTLGYLPSSRMPSGQRRIYREDVEALVEKMAAEREGS